MTQKVLEVRLLNLEKQFSALASRPYNARSEDAKAEALKAQTEAVKAKADIQNVSDEVIENAGTLADFMEEYYLSQFE